MVTIKNRISIIVRKHFFPTNQKLFDTLPGDTFLVSYPRSGNTWMRYLLANLIEPDKEWNINTIAHIIPDLHDKWPIEYRNLPPRIIKSHFPYQSAYKKVIYVYRDGRDVAVSYYDYQTKIHNYQKSFDVFFYEFLHGKLRFGAWHSHLNSWLSKKNEMEILPVKYCDMVNNPGRQLVLVGKFLGYEWNEAQIETATQKSSIEKQKQDYLLYKYDSHGSKGFTGSVHGKPGKWKSILTNEQNDQFWRIAGEVAQNLGYIRNP